MFSWHTGVPIPDTLHHKPTQQYAHALEALPEDHIVAIREVVLNPNVPNVYGRFKEAIIKHFFTPMEESLRTSLARHPLGDAKPCHHLACLQSLAGATTADSKIVRESWLESLPAHVRPMITALLKGTPLN
ncbi:unnamed protein product [Schistosoma curassoni]|uniref:GLOBIN domain-containing protein n=1 Tax=Schistosoma curassoni TaxID=6186 RepID=A0A183KBT1_9TREM|nr:unnamed protein product [Schistosoma curassoni]